MGKTKVGESKVVVEFDSEESFKHLYQRKFGEERFMKRMFAFLRGKIKMDFPVELVKGATIVAFLKDDDSSLTAAYKRFITAALAPAEKPGVKDATDTEQGPTITAAPVDPAE